MNKSIEVDLLPCPFCGSEDMLYNEKCTREEVEELEKMYSFPKENILPCPFCGSKDIHHCGTAYWNDPEKDIEFHYIICNKCKIETRCFDSIEKLVKFWNARK